MTEAEWLNTSTAPHMVEYLASRASQRKLRLFACAACRRILSVMQYEASRTAVELSERFADGQAEWNDLRRAGKEANGLAGTAERLRLAGWNAARTAALAVAKKARGAALRASMMAVGTDLVREHFRNPFRPLTLSPDVLSWQDKTVIRLAQAAYDNRILPAGTLDNARLAVLADALEEAGCSDEQILGHLRSDGEHYRGCWVIDLLLGKE